MDTKPSETSAIAVEHTMAPEFAQRARIKPNTSIRPVEEGNNWLLESLCVILLRHVAQLSIQLQDGHARPVCSDASLS